MVAIAQPNAMQSVDPESIIDRLPIGRFQAVAIMLCGLVAILDGFDTQAIAFVAPVIAGEWSVESTIFGPVFGAGLLGLTFGAIIFGPLADGIGRKWVIIVSTLVFGMFALATAWATDIRTLIILRFLTGLGLGGAMPNIIALTSEYVPARSRATLITLMFCGFPLGAVLGGLLSARLIGSFGWQSVFYLGGFLPALLLPFLCLWLPESVRFLLVKRSAMAEVRALMQRIDPASVHDDTSFSTKETKETRAPVVVLFSKEMVVVTLLMWVIFFANLLILYFLINWLPSLLREAGFPIERAIIATVLLNAGGIVGGLILSRLVDRRNAHGILTFSFTAAAIMVGVIGYLTPSLPLLLAAVFVAGFFVIGSQFGMNYLAAAYYPTSIRSTGVGWALGIGRIGSIVGPVLGGIVIGMGWSPQMIFLACAVPALVSAVAVFVIGFGRQDRMRQEGTARA
jgi:AAHS family 4-hydroxybenzoate transporter-like MFS transporter